MSIPLRVPARAPIKTLASNAASFLLPPIKPSPRLPTPLPTLHSLPPIQTRRLERCTQRRRHTCGCPSVPGFTARSATPGPSRDRPGPDDGNMTKPPTKREKPTDQPTNNIHTIYSTLYIRLLYMLSSPHTSVLKSIVTNICTKPLLYNQSILDKWLSFHAWHVLTQPHVSLIPRGCSFLRSVSVFLNSPMI